MDETVLNSGDTGLDSAGELRSCMASVGMTWKEKLEKKVNKVKDKYHLGLTHDLMYLLFSCILLLSYSRHSVEKL